MGYLSFIIFGQKKYLSLISKRTFINAEWGASLFDAVVGKELH
jgi:hypothetical protein